MSLGRFPKIAPTKPRILQILLQFHIGRMSATPLSDKDPDWDATREETFWR